ATGSVGMGKVDPALSAIVQMAMHVDPERRYQSASDLMKDVQRFLADEPIHARRDSWWQSTQRWIRKHPTHTVATALTLLFLAAACGVAASVRQSWLAARAARITRLRSIANRADENAAIQIQNSRFADASFTLSQSVDLIAGEAQLSDIAKTQSERSRQLRSIVRFQSLSERAQQATFFDRVGRAAVLCQIALNEFNALEHSDWWNHLPDEELTPEQRDHLRSQVYRISALLASMRMAETAQSSASLDMLFASKQIPDQDPARRLMASAALAANRANAFRPSRAMQIILRANQVAVGKADRIDLADLNPRNPVDAAVMGSILDNNTPVSGAGLTALSAILEMRDPHDVATQWLADAIDGNPDWFWLPVFAGKSQMRSGKHETAVTTLSHAIGLRPNDWVGYRYRAAAALSAARDAKLSRRKTEFLNRAASDIQRAMDLQATSPELLFTKALVEIETGASDEQVCRTFLAAFARMPTAENAKSHHYANVLKFRFRVAKQFVQRRLAILREEAIEQNEAPKIPDHLLRLQLVAEIWMNDETAFRQSLRDASTPENSKLEWRSWQRFASGSLSDIENLPASFVWHENTRRADQFLRRGRFLEVDAFLRTAESDSPTLWQQSQTNLLRVRWLIQSTRHPQALEALKNAAQSDPAIDVSDVIQVAQREQATDVLAYARHIRTSQHPYSVDKQPVILRPLIAGGGFEQGLARHWTPFERRRTAGPFTNVNNSNCTARIDSSIAFQGQHSLRIDLDCPIDSTSMPNGQSAYGQLQQSVSVTAGVTYELQLGVRTRGMQDAGAAWIGIQSESTSEMDVFEKVIATAEGWRLQRLRFTATDNDCVILIRVAGSGSIWIDGMKMSAVSE
ncbi:MAG: hypothetical protein AAFP90_12365, partial [Planctomycetota bacterium]